MTQEEKQLDFSVIRESWSEYKLANNTTVKVKASISAIIDTGKKKGKLKEVKIGFQNQFFKQSSPDDKGEPSENTKISEEDIVEELEFEKIREPLNIYDVPEDFILLIRTSLTELKKTRKFNSKGSRIYHYGIDCPVSIVQYPE